MNKILLPVWVYNTLDKYGNVALPKTKYTAEQLRNHLSYKTGKHIKIRKAYFKHYCSISQYSPSRTKHIEVPYYIAYVD